ncbi:hypothetical protein P22_1749 [Propionispora sp. 2/2-37]|uniref:MFS transporter n=1 Tax=Propionispora sp. 2/2-37 TaxID=1677858 RepID=UPI0006BB5C7F|nr:MFS transporter [Propionispora sp. 2/2-37]CUH95673.1 hypothetical protein P22_1749 [Propionispora sp. 2/2-37]
MLSTEWKKNLAVMWGIQFIGMSAITGVISFLPLYVTQLGVTGTAAVSVWSGLLMGITSLCAALSNPYWGAKADRRGRKALVKQVLLFFGLIIIAMSFVSNVYQLLILRILQGFCGGFTAAATALVTSMSPPEKIPFTIGMFQSAMIIGAATGPMAGGFVADTFGYRQPFIVFGVLCLCSLVILHFAVTEKYTPSVEKEKTSIWKNIQYVCSLKSVKLLLFIQFLAQFAIQSIGPILPQYIQSLGINHNNIASISGMIIAIAGIASAIASAGIGYINKYVSNKQILVGAALIGALSFIGQLAVDNLTALSLLRALSGLCIGVMVPCSNTIIAYRLPENKRGAAFGITGGAALLGNVLGPISAGLLSLSFGMFSIFGFTALLFFLVFLLLAAQVETVYKTKTAST